MKKILLIIFIAINSCVLIAQIPYTVEGTVVNNIETGTWFGVNIPRSVPTKLIYRNNSISSVNSEGYLLQAGDENPSVRDNNLDRQEITGNIFKWNGSNDPTIITHGLFTGYNINSIVKYNNLVNVPYGIIFKSGTDDGKNMTFTTGGCAYNICKNGKFSVRLKGINGVKVYNNTFYSGDNDGRYLLLITSNDDRAVPSPSTGSKIFNNIFYSTMQIPMISIGTDCLTNFESDYNVFWCTIGEPTFAIGGVKYTWQQWNALGYDTHSKIINPRFINTNDFVPSDRLDYGLDLGTEWQTGLSTTATWVAGSSPATANQNGTWQVGARIIQIPTIQNVNDFNNFSVNPNPSNGKFKIQIDKMPSEGVVLEIRNVLGQKLLEQKIDNIITEWSVNQYFGSIFFITLRSKDIHRTKRIILNNSMN